MRETFLRISLTFSVHVHLPSLTPSWYFLGSLHMLEPIVGDEPLDSEVVDTWLELGGDTDMGPGELRLIRVP